MSMFQDFNFRWNLTKSNKFSVNATKYIYFASLLGSSSPYSINSNIIQKLTINIWNLKNQKFPYIKMDMSLLIYGYQHHKAWRLNGHGFNVIKLKMLSWHSIVWRRLLNMCNVSYDWLSLWPIKNLMESSTSWIWIPIFIFIWYNELKSYSHYVYPQYLLERCVIHIFFGVLFLIICVWTYFSDMLRMVGTYINNWSFLAYLWFTETNDWLYCLKFKNIHKNKTNIFR